MQIRDLPANVDLLIVLKLIQIDIHVGADVATGLFHTFTNGLPLNEHFWPDTFIKSLIVLWSLNLSPSVAIGFLALLCTLTNIFHRFFNHWRSFGQEFLFVSRCHGLNLHLLPGYSGRFRSYSLQDHRVEADTVGVLIFILILGFFHLILTITMLGLNFKWALLFLSLLSHNFSSLVGHQIHFNLGAELDEASHHWRLDLFYWWLFVVDLHFLEDGWVSGCLYRGDTRFFFFYLFLFINWNFLLLLIANFQIILGLKRLKL